MIYLHRNTASTVNNSLNNSITIINLVQAIVALLFACVAAIYAIADIIAKKRLRTRTIVALMFIVLMLAFIGFVLVHSPKTGS